MKRLLLLPIILQSSILPAQKNVGDTYKAANVIDSTYGIIQYNALIGSIGGDSTRYDAMKLPMQGLVIDMYDNGQMLHKGSYDKGKLVSFNNYYPDGKKERSFVSLSTTMCNLKVFYENGKTRSEVDYRSGEAKKWVDYYANGQIEFYEEYSGDMAYILSRKGFKENGKPDYDLELVSSKNRKYEQKEFYPDGKLHLKGELLFFEGINDLRKDGLWQTYNEKGNLILAEHFAKGEVTETQDSLALANSSVYSKQTETAKKKEKEKQEEENKKAAEKELAEQKKQQKAQEQKDKNNERSLAQTLANQKKAEEKKRTDSLKLADSKQKQEKKSQATSQKLEEKKVDSGQSTVDNKKTNDDQLALNTTKEEPKKEEPKVEVPNMKSGEKKEDIKEEPKIEAPNSKSQKKESPQKNTDKETKKTTNTHSPLVVPAQFKFADKDKNGKISAPEVSQAINAFFDDESGKLKPEDISKLIDYFFDQ